MIFMNEEDRRFFLALLRDTRRMGISVFAYCLMGNHFHLMLGTGDTPLSTPMHQLLMRYSLHFNGINSRVGHLFESRFTAVPCINDRHLVRLIAYIHLNPVRAGLAKTPGDWPWSSHSEFSSGRGDLLDLDPLVERTGYSATELRSLYADAFKAPPQPEDPKDLRALIAEVAQSMGIDPAVLFGGACGRTHSKVKRIVIERATLAGFTLSAIASELRCSREALSLLKKRSA